MKKLILIFIVCSCSRKSVDYQELVELRKINKELSKQLIEFSVLNQEYIRVTSLKLAQKDTIISYLKTRKRNADRRMEISTNHKSN